MKGRSRVDSEEGRRAMWEGRFDRLQRLYRVSQVIHSTLEPNRALELILEQAVELTRASSGSVALLNPTTGLLEIQVARGLPAAGVRLKLRLGEGITGWVARHGRTARVGEVSKDPRYVRVRARARSELAVPLEVADEVRGVINVDSDRAQAFTEEDESLLEELSAQAAAVIQNTWLYEQLRLKARLFESLVKVGQTINSALNVGDALRLITREACQLMDARMSALLLLDATGEWLDLQASHGAGEGYLRKPRLSVAESLVGGVVRRRKPVQVADVQHSTRYQSVEVARREGLVSLLSVPLVFGVQAIGVLNVYKAKQHFFSNDEIRILSALADLSALAIEKARLIERLVDVEEQLRHQEKLSVLGLLAAEVAHEIRNPLTVLKMLYHSLDLRFAPDDPRSRDAKIMGEKMEQLNRIVERILDFARTSEPAVAPVDLGRLIEELCLLTRHKLQQQGIRLVQRVDRAVPEVMADGVQLSQAFLNLMLNAVEAMPRGGQLTVVVRRCAPNRGAGRIDRVQIEFRDTGQGMTVEQQRRVFSSLLTTTKAQGTGLGLAVVGKIVEAHHGQLTVRSRPGAGSLFRITLPV
jgi:signal transduction histidine kinase